MVGQLEVIGGPDQGRKFKLEEGQTLLLGRGQNTGTRLKDPQASRVHATVSVDGNRILVEDAGSTAGTYVNGRKIAAVTELRPGDVVQVGGTPLRYTYEGAPETSTVVVPGQQPPACRSQDTGESLTDLMGKRFAYC